MNSRFIFFTVLLVVVFSLMESYAQQGILSTGGDATGDAGSFSYSVGQVSFTTLTGTTGSITEGVQQPYEILLDGIYNEPGISLKCMIYPNPATTSLILKIEGQEIKKMDYKVCNLNGMVLEESGIKDNETTILLDEFVSGTYLLIVSENNRTVAFHKIIKR